MKKSQPWKKTGIRAFWTVALEKEVAIAFACLRKRKLCRNLKCVKNRKKDQCD